MSEKKQISVLKKGFDGMRRRLLGGALAGVGNRKQHIGPWP